MRSLRIAETPSGLAWGNGKAAGCQNKRGYWVVQFGGKQYRAHRIVYALDKGIQIDSLDGFEVDHIDQNKANNSPENLRLATRQENSRNVTKYRGKSGVKGAFLTKHGTFRCNIDGVHLGTFKTIFEAACVILPARLLRHGLFASS